MATTATTQLGPNSWVVSYAMGAPIADIRSAVTEVLVSASWVVHDSAAGTNAICYKSTNADGITTKYVVLDYNSTGFLYVKPYEFWNSTTHVGTNMAFRADEGSYYVQALNTSTDKGLIYIFANARYMSFIIRQYSSSILGNSNTCGVTGAFEFSRDNPDDTPAAGFPVHAFINTGMLGEGVNTSYPSLTVCRSKAGTGSNTEAEISTIFGKTSSSGSIWLSSLLPNTTSLFSGKDWAISLYVQDGGTGTNLSVRGRVFGLKAFTIGKLNFMDKIQVPCDASLNYDPNGALTDHFVIPGGRQGAGLYNVRFLIPA